MPAERGPFLPLQADRRSEPVFKKTPDRAVRDAFDDAAGHGLSGQFALTPVTDWDIERLGVFTGQGHDLADRFRCERRRRTAARRVAQARCHAGGWYRIPPPAAPVTGRLAPNPQSLGWLTD